MPSPRSLTIEETNTLLNSVLPQGLFDEQALAQLCPAGWLASPYFPAFHPPLEECYRSHCQHLEKMDHLDSLLSRRDAPDAPPPKPAPTPKPTYQEFLETHGDESTPATEISEADAREEFCYLLGICLWDILSDNNDLLLPTGELAHPGSFRMVGGLIAEHHQLKDPAPPKYCYMDFYMGAKHLTHRINLVPIYQLFFQRLKNISYDWIYEQTSLGVVDCAKPKDTSPENYDPSKALAEEKKEKAEAAKFKKLQNRLAKAAQKDKRVARQGPLPQIIQAYQNINKRFPKNWPPDIYEK